MIPRLVVYEDPGWQRLLPLVYARAVFQLVCGMGGLLDKIQGLPGAEGTAPGLWCRTGLVGIAAERTGLQTNQTLDRSTLLLNGCGLWSGLPPVQPGEKSWVGTSGKQEHTACIYADAGLAPQLSSEILLDEEQTRAILSGLPRRDIGTCVKLIDWPWELIHTNLKALADDWHSRAGQAAILGEIAAGSHLLARESIHIGAGARIKPCAVIDAEDGPVWIGRDAKILPHTYVQGPACIGDGAVVQAGAVVRAGSFIGPFCKVGGEIEASIIQGYSNKQHDGFLGHSYVCSWVNIAADCVNSDLKNTYGTIRVPINGREVDTGEMFVGALIGDHSKTGINVSLPTGAVVGFCSSVFAARSPKFAPSFSWIDGDRIESYDPERGLEVARKVMARRDKTMSAGEAQAFLSVAHQAREIEIQPD